MPKLFVSNYVKAIPVDDKYLLFNGVNGSMDEVTGGLGRRLENNGTVFDSSGMDELEIEFLIHRGHITTLTPTAEQEQFRQYVAKIDAAKLKNTTTGGLMFLLSYVCNLDCYYCYQKDVRRRGLTSCMDRTFIESFFTDYYQLLFKDIPPANTVFTLYGGEPLLERNRPAIEAILEYSASHLNPVHAVSNCIFAKHFLDLLGPLPGQINTIQVSLDGDQNTHDYSRIGKDRLPTFAKIIDAIHRILDRKTKLLIRINIEQNGIYKLEGLVELLRNEEILDHPYAHVYIHPLHCNLQQVDNTTFLSHREVTAAISRLGYHQTISHPVRRTANDIRYLMDIQEGVGLFHTRFCMQSFPNSYVLDPYNDLYACYEEAGRPEYAVGRLINGEVEYFPLREVVLDKGVQNQPECMQCAFALICGGNCSCANRARTGNIFDTACVERKELMTEAIKELYGNNRKLTEPDQELIVSRLAVPNL